jgi:hypothetical protein
LLNSRAGQNETLRKAGQILTEKRRKYLLNIKVCKTGGLLRGRKEHYCLELLPHLHNKNVPFNLKINWVMRKQGTSG